MPTPTQYRDDLLEELAQEAERLAADLMSFDGGAFSRTEPVVLEFKNAHSGGWIGYHSTLYLRDFVPRDPRRHVFDLEWGLLGSMGTSTEGPWTEYTREEVWAEFDERAGLDARKIDRFKTLSDSVARQLERIRTKALTVLEAIKNPSRPIEDLKVELSKVTVTTTVEILNEIRRPGAAGTRDSRALSGGFVTPAYLLRWFQLTTFVYPSRAGDEMAGLLRRARDSLEVSLLLGADMTPEIESGRALDDTRNRTVFVVHGHDDTLRHETTKLLERMGLTAIVLDDTASRGRTIIEKFEEEGERAGFAVVLATPDDVGGKDAGDDTALRARARQNVVFELGFFIGKLGRKRVCLLRRGDVEILSDMYGVIYIGADSGWEMKLVKELRAAGLEANWEAAFD